MRPATNAREAFDCQATAALLRSLAPLAWASHVSALIAIFGVGVREAWPVLVCWPVVLYFAVRVSLDAGLFELLARDPEQSPARLDEWLESTGLRTRPLTTRGVEDRCRGARRLARSFAGAWLLQMFMLVLVLVWRNI